MEAKGRGVGAHQREVEGEDLHVRARLGGEGEGFVAVVYGIDGRLSDPQVSVNPLSVLTPGFLRGIFGIKGGNGDSRPRAVPGRTKG